MKIEVLRTERLFDGFFKLDRAVLRHELPGGGMSDEMTRLNLERGDGAAVLLLNLDHDSVVLTRQFRYAPWLRGDGDQFLEIPAGTVSERKSPVQVARSEIFEEVGYRAGRLKKLMMFYATPGTTTERTHLFFGRVHDRHKVSAGGGLDTEQEHIEVVELPVVKAWSMIERGAICDAKTIIALQWLQQDRSRRAKRR